jgi:hypothetical protein
MVVGFAGAALAHWVYQRGYVWENGSGKCLEARSEISHGKGGGYSKANANSIKEIQYPWGKIDCNQKWRRPAGYIRVKNQLDVYTSGQWAFCRKTSLKYNSADNWGVSKARNWGTSPPCGSHYYTNWARAQHIWQGDWTPGGWISSGGSHWLPAD